VRRAAGLQESVLRAAWLPIRNPKPRRAPPSGLENTTKLRKQRAYLPT